jgi:hypothetical protein
MSADEEKTRILQSRPAAAKPSAAAPAERKEADQQEKIVFHCPNGHRIVAPAALAGKKGKCSKCQIDVTIPRPGAEAGPEPPPPVVVGPVSSAPEPDLPGPGVATERGADLPEITIGPPPAPPPAGGEDVVAGPPDPDADSDERENWSFIGGEAEPAAPEAFDGPDWDTVDVGEGFATPADNPTAMLVARLWAERQHGGIIELHLEGGSVILPEWYDANWSRGTHGLFASQAADGSVTLTAVAWDTVRKVVVRQLTEVPNDMFT